MRVLSSFGPDGWDVYGKTFVESFLEYWPCELHVYYEEKPDFEHPRLTWIPLFELPGMMKFLEAISMFPACQGHYQGKRYYQFDLFRFCRKSFAQHHAAEHYEGKLFWLDADVVTRKPVPETLLAGMLKDVYMCYLGRADWHSCASFIGWDTTHEMNRAFMQTYLNVYLSGDIFHLPEWHDSFIVDKVREGTNVPARNLTEHIITEGPANIFDMSSLGEFAHHLKGQLKFQKEA